MFHYLLSDPGQRLIQNILGILALCFAVRGVRNWNRERRDIRRGELAERALAHAYRLRDAISIVRSPFGFQGEGASRKSDSSETPEKKQRLDEAFTSIERLSQFKNEFEELATLAYSIDAAFGPKSAAPLREFNIVRNSIVVAARSRMRRAHRDAEQLSEHDLTAIERDEGIIWSGADDDQIAQKLNAAVSDLEARFRPFVEARFDTSRYRDFWKTLFAGLKRHFIRR